MSVDAVKALILLPVSGLTVDVSSIRNGGNKEKHGNAFYRKGSQESSAKDDRPL